MKKIAVILPTSQHTLTGLKSAQPTPFTATNIDDLKEKNFDALIVLGDVPEAASAIAAFHSASKPIGAFDQGIELVTETLGRKGVVIASAITENCAPNDFVTDRENKVVSTHSDLIGIRRALAELIEMA